jgi:hypothetical protein
MQFQPEHILHSALKFAGGLFDEEQAAEYIRLEQSGALEETENKVINLFNAYYFWVEKIKQLDCQWFTLSNDVANEERNKLQLNGKGPFDDILESLCYFFLDQVVLILGKCKRFYPYYYGMECIFKRCFPFRSELPKTNSKQPLAKKTIILANNWISEAQGLMKTLMQHCNETKLPDEDSVHCLVNKIHHLEDGSSKIQIHD